MNTSQESNQRTGGLGDKVRKSESKLTGEGWKLHKMCADYAIQIKGGRFRTVPTTRAHETGDNVS